MIDDNTSTTTTGQQLLYNNNNNNDNNNKGSIINNNWSLASLLAQEPRSVYDPPQPRHHHRPTFTPHHHRHRRHHPPPTVVDLDCSSPSRDPVPPSPFSCETCHKAFTDPSNLQRHVRSAHASARCHTCPDCGKAFATSSGLKQHQHIHSSVKPFRCEVCLKAYTQFSNLCRHKRMHADCRQQIRCRGCHQEFATSTSLSKHRRFCDDAGHHLEPYSLNRDANGAFSTLEGFSTSPAVTARGSGLPCGTLSAKSTGYSSLYGAQGAAGGICLYPNFFHPPFQFPLFQAGLPLFGSAGVVGGTNLMQVRKAGLYGRAERRRREAEGFYPTEEETVIDDEEEDRSCSASSQVSSLSSRCLIDEGEDAKSPVSLPGTSPTDRSSSGSDDACPVSKVPRQRPVTGTISSDSEYNIEEQGLRKMSPGSALSAVGKTFEDIEADEVSEGEESGTTTSDSPKRSWDVEGNETSKGSDDIQSPKRVKTLDTIENPKQPKTMETLESHKMLKTTDAIESPKRTKTLDTIEIPRKLKTLNTTESPKRFNGTEAQGTHRIHDFTNVDEMATSEMLPLDLSLKSKPTSSPKHLSGFSHQKPTASSPTHNPPFQPTSTPSPPSHPCTPLPRWLHNNNNTRPRPPGNDCALPPGFQDIAARIRSLQSTGVPMFPLCLPPRNFPGLSRQRDRVYPFLSPLMKGPGPSPYTGAPSAPMGKYKDRYSCRFCGKVFPRSANLTRHLRTHTGEQPYKCKYCERSFSISSNLQRHVRNIHNKEKPFRCLLCDRCFGQQTNLDRHLRKHDPPSLPGSPPPLLPRGRLRDRDREYSAEEDDVVPGKEEEYQQLPGWDEIDDPVDVEMMTECNDGQLEEGSEADVESRNEPEGVYLSDNDVEGCYDNRSSFSDDDDDDGKRFLPVYPLNGSFSVVSGLHVDT